MRRFLLAAILASSVLNGAAADERLRNNPIVGDAVPPPEELAPPSADIPPGIAAWYGRWSGLWDGKWPVVVAITGIRESGDGYVATGRYYWRETLTERYRTREGAPWEVPVTINEVAFSRVTMQRDYASSRTACAFGAFPAPRAAGMIWSPHAQTRPQEKQIARKLMRACRRKGKRHLT